MPLIARLAEAVRHALCSPAPIVIPPLPADRRRRSLPAVKDVRTMPHAILLAGLRRDISRALAVCEPVPRRVDPGQDEMARRAQLAPPCETSRQAMEQGAGDGFRVRDLEASVAAHGGRFVEVHAR